MSLENFEIGRVLHLKSEIPKSQIGLVRERCSVSPI